MLLLCCCLMSSHKFYHRFPSTLYHRNDEFPPILRHHHLLPQLSLRQHIPFVYTFGSMPHFLLSKIAYLNQFECNGQRSKNATKRRNKQKIRTFWHVRFALRFITSSPLWIEFLFYFITLTLCCRIFTCQVGQWWTKCSPAATNSSGVRTPVSRNFDSCYKIHKLL